MITIITIGTIINIITIIIVRSHSGSRADGFGISCLRRTRVNP